MVRSRVGAWIETSSPRAFTHSRATFAPVRERGLKQGFPYIPTDNPLFASVRERG